MGKDAPLGASLGHRNNQMRFGAEAFGQREDTTRGEKRASGWSRGQHPPWRGGGQAWLCGRLCSRRPQPRASPLQPYRCLQTALHHEAPSHMRPRAMRRQVPAAGPALVQGGVFTGAGRRRPALAQSSLRPSCCWTSMAPCWPRAEPDLHSPGAVCALKPARPPGVTGAREVGVPPRPHPRPAKLPAALSRLHKDTAHNTHAIQKPKVHC